MVKGVSQPIAFAVDASTSLQALRSKRSGDVTVRTQRAHKVPLGVLDNLLLSGSTMVRVYKLTYSICMYSDWSLTVICSTNGKWCACFNNSPMQTLGYFGSLHKPVLHRLAGEGLQK